MADFESGAGTSEGSLSPKFERSTSPSSISSGSISIKREYKKRDDRPPRAAVATGISTTIPVTGERPRPEPHNSLDDDVLFAIFEILYDLDPKGKGMTVKQICDVMSERHPDMAKLSTKTSNLVSAKLNAYVKRVEKGERSLVYAMSRDWADASPKRMVYVYRGILTKDFFLHAQLKEEDEDSLVPRARRSTMFDGKRPFMDTVDHISAIPYSCAPVTASLRSVQIDSDESEESEDEEPVKKRSKSMSALTSKNHVTAAAAAPRISEPSNSALRAAVMHAFTTEGKGMTAGIILSAKWLETLRSGFFTHDIRTPEEISLADLDSLL